MGLPLVEMQVAAQPFVGHELLIFFRSCHGDQFVLGAQENNRGRRVFVDVMQRRNLLPVVLHPIVAISRRPVVVDRVEQDKRIGSARDTQVLACLIESLGGCRRRGHMAAGRPSAGCHLVRVDTQFSRVPANPSEGRFSIFHALAGCSLMPALHPILGRHGDHAPGGQVLAVGIELARRAAVPTATKEKHDGRASVRGLVARRQKHIESEFGLPYSLVRDGSVRLKAFYFKGVCWHRTNQQERKAAD